MPEDPPSSRVVVALDVPTLAEALAIVARLGDAAGAYKVGLQLLTAEGPAALRALVAAGKAVFLDLKLHEIPNSVASAVDAAGRLGVGMVTVHASAGSAALRAAVAAAAPHPGLRILALTVITSLRDADLPEIGLAPSVRAQVERLADLAAACGCHGVVASADEADWLAERLPAGMCVVTPGVQFADGPATDQARVATPERARRAGATHIVVGRAITRAADPVAAFGAALAAMSRPRGGSGG